MKRYFCHIFERLNPLNWSIRTIKVVTALFSLIFLPIYLFLGFQPSLPADAANYPVLSIPTIHLETPVAPVELIERELKAPATIAGAYSSQENKILIIGHSSTVFKKLDQILIGDTFIYDNEQYRIQDTSIRTKSDINMSEVLAASGEKTIVIMTCAGTPLPDQDATHRLIITATKLQK